MVFDDSERYDELNLPRTFVWLEKFINSIQMSNEYGVDKGISRSRFRFCDLKKKVEFTSHY